MRGFLCGFNHVSGTTKEGKNYDFHKFYFEIPTPDTGRGKIVESYLSSDQEIIKKLTSVKALPVEVYFSPSKNYLNDCDLLSDLK